MIPVYLGESRETGEPIYLDLDLFRTHMHLVGATGSGKTTAVHAILKGLMSQVKKDECCLFVIDPMGGLSRDLLAFIAHPTKCTQRVRDRLVYIEPAREDVVMPINPLIFTSPANRYYQTMRAVDLVLRGWSAQDVTQQPRLLQWTFKTFCAAAEMGFPISMCRHLIHPGSPQHSAIMDRLPGENRYEWQDILNSRGREATTILESTRNRLDPFFRSPILHAMFGSLKSRFDCERFIRERKIVILNLASMSTIPPLTAHTIGALALNEIFESASRMTSVGGRSVVDPTYVLLDEFQNYVSVDIEHALPTVRQLGLRLILAHQSFAQLDRDDINLEQMIWQARSRLVFANYAKDADILADELAKLTFDSKVVKDIRYSRKQLIQSYRKEWLMSEGKTENRSSGSSKQKSDGRSGSTTFANPGVGSSPSSETLGTSSGGAESFSDTSTFGYSATHSQAMVPVHENVVEVSSLTYEPFDEFAIKWGQALRSLGEGESFLQLPGSRKIQPIQIDFDPIEETPELCRAIDELKQKNFESDFFVSREQANREYEQSWQEVLKLPLQGNSGNQGRHHDGTPATIPRPDQAANDSSPSGFTL